MGLGLAVNAYSDVQTSQTTTTMQPTTTQTMQPTTTQTMQPTTTMQPATTMHTTTATQPAAAQTTTTTTQTTTQPASTMQTGTDSNMSNTMGTQMQTMNKDNSAGDAFLAANKTKPGVVTLPSGLQYKVITEGTGATPTANSVVTVNYAGTLIDGTEFDSSYKRGEPATFPVNGVIAGWTEALQLMKVGSKWELYIPASLAYGANGAPPVIGPNQTLIFTVELLGVK